MEEENFNWVEQYLEIQKKKDIKNTNAYETLIDNNIDTNELQVFLSRLSFPQKSDIGNQSINNSRTCCH